VDHADTIRRAELDKLNYKASKEERKDLIDKSATTAQRYIADSKTARMNISDLEILAKLERIGVNSRLTPADMASRKELSKPEQAEIDTFNLRLRQVGRDASLVDLTSPSLIPIPQSESEWAQLGFEFEYRDLDERYDKNEAELQTILDAVNAVKINSQTGKPKKVINNFDKKKN
jgi:hypothetical protein